MKKFYWLVFLIVLSWSFTSYAQVTTYFYGKDPILSSNKKYTAALYSVSIYENLTKVTIELVPKRNHSRMNFWTSRNTYIVVGNNIELPIIGFIHGSKTEIDTSPFSGDWGWDDVKAGKKYYYTMVFSGKIPPGVTNFTLKDKGDYNGNHGFSWSNYTLKNPKKETKTWSEYAVKQYADSNNDGICGIYEGSDSQRYKLGCIKQNEVYYLVYLSSKDKMSWWQVGDIKAVLRSSATKGFFKASWYMKNKTVEDDCYIVFDGGSMKTIIDGDESFYLKMYPIANSSPLPESTEWTGTGFALNNGYIVTNYHVVEDAKSITVNGIKGDFNNVYTAEVAVTDKYNDIAVLKVSDSKFTGFGAIPYKIKTSIADVGEEIFVLGYPLTTTMGDEIKLTTGVVSSRTGFQGDVALYQISAPVQPGNSGGPLFDGKGNLIGIVSAKHTGAENVGYAIKVSCLQNLVESSITDNIMPTNNTISTLPLTGKVKNVKSFVFLIECSSK